jgi:hypothetical protein
MCVGIHWLGGELNLLRTSARFAHNFALSYGAADRIAYGVILFTESHHEDVAVSEAVVVIFEAIYFAAANAARIQSPRVVPPAGSGKPCWRANWFQRFFSSSSSGWSSLTA